MDVAASEFFSGEDKTYDLNFKYAETEGGQKLSGRDLTSFYSDLIDHFPIVSIEDPFDQDDWDSWVHMNKEVGERVQIVGDDLTVTNIERIQTAIKTKACGALLLKVRTYGLSS